MFCILFTGSTTNCQTKIKSKKKLQFIIGHQPQTALKPYQIFLNWNSYIVYERSNLKMKGDDVDVATCCVCVWGGRSGLCQWLVFSAELIALLCGWEPLFWWVAGTVQHSRMYSMQQGELGPGQSVRSVKARPLCFTFYNTHSFFFFSSLDLPF